MPKFRIKRRIPAGFSDPDLTRRMIWIQRLVVLFNTVNSQHWIGTSPE